MSDRLTEAIARYDADPLRYLASDLITLIEGARWAASFPTDGDVERAMSVMHQRNYCHNPMPCNICRADARAALEAVKP